MRVAIVENMALTHHGQIGAALRDAGAVVDVYRPYEGGGLPEDPSTHDALVVFGGEQSARDDDLHPYLPDLARAMRRFGEADRAVLGICLGSQLLARAWGAVNHLGTAPEFGWQQIRLTDAGRADPVLSVAPDSFHSFQWHSDTFTLPAGAIQLATADGVAQQAFRIGRASYATQFHFEADRDVVASWSRAFPEAADRHWPGWAEAHPGLAATLGVGADAAGLALARAWVAVI